MEGIDITVMGLREALMTYFKGDCVENLVEADIRLDNRLIDGRYQYLRLDNQRRNPATLSLHNIPLMELQKRPDKLVLYKAVFTRSKELSAVYDALLGFLERYLPNVDIEYNEERSF